MKDQRKKFCVALTGYKNQNLRVEDSEYDDETILM